MKGETCALLYTPQTDVEERVAVYNTYFVTGGHLHMVRASRYLYRYGLTVRCV
jgi:hypothetical protein